MSPLHDHRVVAHGRVAMLSIGAAHRASAVGVAEVHRLLERLRAAEDDEVCEAVVLRGSGQHFCSGVDLADAAPRVDRAEAAQDLERLLGCLAATPLLTIALVTGAARGLGVAITAACDVVIADADATFAMPELRIGIPPTAVLPPLTRAIGRRAARAWVLDGRVRTAREALDAGLVTTLHRGPSGALDGEALAVVDGVPRGHLRDTKAIFKERGEW